MQRLAMLVATALLAGCGQGVAMTSMPSAAPSVSPANTPTSAPTITPSPTPTPTPTASPTLTPERVLDFPTTSEQRLEPGRYSSSPPFDIPFTFEVPPEGWSSAHLHREFFDMMQFVSAESVEPLRWIAFAHPEHILAGEEVPVAGLTPDAAAALLVTRSELRTGPTSAHQLDGLQGVRLDINTDAAGVQLFGGPDGEFGMDPAYDLRLGILPYEGELLLVLVLAPLSELDQAWALAEPLLESVDL